MGRTAAHPWRVLATMLSRKRECSQLMTEREFEEFWQNVDSSRHRRLSPGKQFGRRADEEPREQEADPKAEDDNAGPANPQTTAAARSAKTARCGSCEACRAKDCGECKNCLDKPRFGGPGVKKKACINRVCLNADQPPSPALRPADCKPGGPPSFGLPDALTRGPLLPLDSQPLAAANLYSPQPAPEAYPVGASTKLELLLASHGINWYR